MPSRVHSHARASCCASKAPARTAKLANALSRQTTQRESLNQSTREPVAAVRRAAEGLRERPEVGTRHRHSKKRDRARDARRPQAMILAFALCATAAAFVGPSAAPRTTELQHHKV